MDYLLQTQDLNQDGLLAPSELLSSTIDHQQENKIVPHGSTAGEALNQEQTHPKSEDGVSETHHQDVELNQESEHENETQDSAKENKIEAENHNQIPEKLEELQDQLQPPEEQELQDDHQEQKNIRVHQEQ